jgi:hypothetical protein
VLVTDAFLKPTSDDDHAALVVAPAAPAGSDLAQPPNIHRSSTKGEAPVDEVSNCIPWIVIEDAPIFCTSNVSCDVAESSHDT